MEKNPIEDPSVLILGDHAIGLRMAFARALDDLGVRVTVAHPPGLTLEPGSPSIRTVEYPVDARHVVRASRAVRDLRRETRSAVVHAFSTLPATISGLASRRDPDGCYVRTVNGLGRSFSTTGMRGTAMRLAYSAVMITLDRRVRCAVFQNHDDDAWFAHNLFLRGRRHQVILGSGADTVSFDPASVSADRRHAARTFLGADGRPTALLISRHLRSKGVDDLSAAAQLCGVRTDQAMLLAVVGPPSDNPRDMPSATDSHAGSVEFKRLGAWKDIPALLAEADVVVLPTRYREGIPRVLIEGAAMGMPLLAYDVPGCREIVEPGGNGVLIAPGDIEGLAGHLLALLGDPAERIRLGSRSRALVEERFDVRLIAAQYADLYAELSGCRRPASSP